MTQFSITVSDRTVPITLDGHARVRNSLGAHLFAEEDECFSLVISNGWVNHGESIGGIYWDAIRLNCPFPVVGVPMVAHAYGTDERLVVGSENGQPHNYLAPRAIHVVRFARKLTNDAQEWRRIFDRPMRRGNSPHVAAPESLAYLKTEYDVKGEQNLQRLASTSGFGPFPVEGGERGDDPGGQDINGTPGCDRSFLYWATRHMLRSNRTPLAWIDATNGKPLLSQRAEYFGSRTWNKSGVLAEFVMPRSMSPYDDNRIARDVNSGSADYRWHFVPVETSPGVWTYPYEPDDTAHLCRGTAASKALRFLYRDKAATLTLAMTAADAWATWHSKAVGRAQGLPGQPLRDWGWTLDALTAAGYKAQADLMVRNLDSAQMSNGSWQRWPSANQAGLGSPNPWVDMGMDPSYDATHTMENAYVALALAAGGRVPQAEKCLRGMYTQGDPEVWQAVAQNGTIFSTAKNVTGTLFEKHQHWGALGVLARTKPEWRRQMTLLSAPDGGVCGQDVKGALLRSKYWDGVAAALESLEL